MSSDAPYWNFRGTSTRYGSSSTYIRTLQIDLPLGYWPTAKLCFPLILKLPMSPPWVELIMYTMQWHGSWLELMLTGYETELWIRESWTRGWYRVTGRTKRSGEQQITSSNIEWYRDNPKKTSNKNSKQSLHTFFHFPFKGIADPLSGQTSECSLEHKPSAETVPDSGHPINPPPLWLAIAVVPHR